MGETHWTLLARNTRGSTRLTANCDLFYHNCRTVFDVCKITWRRKLGVSDVFSLTSTVLDLFCFLKYHSAGLEDRSCISFLVIVWLRTRPEVIPPLTALPGLQSSHAHSQHQTLAQPLLSTGLGWFGTEQCKAKRHHLLTLQVTRYYFLALHGRLLWFVFAGETFKLHTGTARLCSQCHIIRSFIYFSLYLCDMILFYLKKNKYRLT